MMASISNTLDVKESDMVAWSGVCVVSPRGGVSVRRKQCGVDEVLDRVEELKRRLELRQHST